MRERKKHERERKEEKRGLECPFNWKESFSCRLIAREREEERKEIRERKREREGKTRRRKKGESENPEKYWCPFFPCFFPSSQRS